MNRFVSLLVFICLTSFTNTFAGGNGQGAAVHTLVIDPGHGGMDPGAIGPGGHHEADLALAVSLKFGEMVKQAFPDVKIIYTRTTDKFVSLADRADMANKAKADLFICIHLNSATNHDAYGTSTYVLGLHRTDDNLEIAKRENAVIELEGDKDKNYEFDPNSPEGHIIMSMKQNAFLDQSILIASKIEDELAVLSKRKSRGVKQAGFWVLYKTAMPSLLAEIGFISNPSEEQYLSTDVGQANIATSIFKAFRSYKYDIEGTKDTAEKKTEATTQVVKPAPASAAANNNPPKAQENPQPAATADNQKPKENPQPVNLNKQETKKEEKIWQPDTTAVVTTPAPKTENKDFKPIDKVAAVIPDTVKESAPPRTEKKPVALKDENTAITKSEPIPNPTPKEEPVAVKPEAKPTKSKEEPVAVKPEPKPTKPKEEPVAKSEPKPAAKPAPKPAEQPKTAAGGKESAYFTVQLLAAKRKPAYYDDMVNTFGLMNREEIGDGVVRYMAGSYATYSEAKKALETAHTKGVKDAFIVGYLNKRRLDGRATMDLAKRYP